MESQIELTKITCNPAESKFIVLFLRSRGISKNDLLLYPVYDYYKIIDPEIKGMILSCYRDFKRSQLTLEDYWECNIVTAIDLSKNESSQNRQIEFNLQQRSNFDESRKVR